MNIAKIAVLGAGTMGSGIAQVFATSGFEVLMIDLNDEILSKGRSKISKSLAKIMEKGKLTEEPADIISRITASTITEDAKDYDFILESTSENKKIKDAVFSLLGRISKENTILASNTSSVSITSLGTISKIPERVIGMRFMNPAPLMELVEIVIGEETSPETLETTKALAVKLGKTPVVVEDFPGFISNRILIPMINEAIFCLMENVGSAEDIDTVMKLGMNHPMGPLALADLIGLDICLEIMNVLYEGFKDSKYRPCPLLVRMVSAGHLGRKSGQGFYKYQ